MKPSRVEGGNLEIKPIMGLEMFQKKIIGKR